MSLARSVRQQTTSHKPGAHVFINSTDDDAQKLTAFGDVSPLAEQACSMRLVGGADAVGGAFDCHAPIVVSQFRNTSDVSHNPSIFAKNTKFDNFIVVLKKLGCHSQTDNGD